MAKFEYDKEKWIKQQNEKLANIHKDIKNMAESYKDNPETIAELMEFQSRFYQYSIRNNMLIRGQNPHSTYVSSYKDWLNKGYRVKKGEKGLAIFVPFVSEVFKPLNNNEKYKKVSQATPEEKQLIKSKEIKTYTITNFRLGYVFDISQTNCPVEKYPEFYNMGYSSQQHAALYEKLKEYSNSIGISVNENDLKSIALRGRYYFHLNEIQISDKLNDTEKLSTLSHELGHAIMHKYNDKIPTVVKEYEADCISIMLQSHMGIELTEGRKSHLSTHYNALGNDFDFDESLKRINKTYSAIIPEINKLITPEQIKKEVKPQAKSKSYNTPKYSKEDNKAIYDSIKQNIDIVELARDLGYTPVKEGSLYSLKEHDSLKIYPKTNSFTRFSKEQSNGKYQGGSVIDLMMELTGATTKDSIEYLKKKINVPQFLYSNNNYNKNRSNQQALRKQDKITPFVLPKKVKGKYIHAFAYLSYTRKIEPTIINELMQKEHIYEDEHFNVVFCGKDENDKIVYATKKSTNTKLPRPFPPIDVSGSNQEVGIFINNNANTLVINEAFIDSMSYMSLMSLKGKDYHKQNYLSLNGISGKPVIHHLKNNKNINKVIFALDSDEPGKTATKKIKSMVEDYLKENNRDVNIEVCVPHTKDFNDDLKEVRKKQQKKLCPSNSRTQQYELER